MSAMYEALACPDCAGFEFLPIPDNPEFDVDTECDNCANGFPKALVDVVAGAFAGYNETPVDDRMIALEILSAMSEWEADQ